MTPEEMVPDLGLCKRLKELGWERETYFCWCKYVDGNSVKTHPENGAMRICPAPTVAEMGEVIISPWCVLKTGDFWIGCQSCGYELCGDGLFRETYDEAAVSYCPYDRKEANAKGKMIIWLVENGHMKAEDLK